MLEYDQLKSILTQQRLYVFEQNPQQLVVAASNDKAQKANSFWLCRDSDNWYLSTWTNNLYLIPASIAVDQLVLECISSAKHTIYVIPDEITSRFHLEQLDSNRADEILKHIFKNSS